MLDTSKTYQSNNYGQFKIFKYINSANVIIQFITTKTKLTTSAGSIKRGKVRDIFYPSIYGIGFVGEGKYKPSVCSKLTKAYAAWTNMIERCYSAKYHKRYPTYKGCIVAPIWHNFQAFAEFFEVNYKAGQHLDKDKLIKGNKVYSPEHCLFICGKENSALATAKHYKFIDSQGTIVNVYNLSKFCQENNLHYGCMRKVHLHKAKHYKGWTVG